MEYKSGSKVNDDYDWEYEYPNWHLYQTKLIDNDPHDAFDLYRGFHFIDGKLILPYEINPNKILLYETIYKYQPKTVLEIGFGLANNLYSISKILPEAQLYGCDISSQQYFNAIDRYGENIQSLNLSICDFLDYEPGLNFDFIYSNAVIMHMNTEKAKASIRKAFDLLQPGGKFLSLDGKLLLEDHKAFLYSITPHIDFLTGWAEQHWTENYVEPFILYKD